MLVRRRLRAALAALALGLACSCDGADGTADAGPRPDAGAAHRRDAGFDRDGGRARDGAAADAAAADAAAADAAAADAAADDAGPGDGALTDSGAAVDGGVGRASRGYWTTPEELLAAHDLATAGRAPWDEAEARVLSEAGEPGAWTFGTLDGEVDCGGSGGSSPEDPLLLSNQGGGPVVLAKAYAFVLTGDEAYAAAVRERLLDLTDTTSWGGEVYSGANQCILNLSWFIPRFVQAADLLEGWSGWTDADRAAFSRWLAEEVYPKTSWASEARHNNWGTAGSYTSAVIADYLTGGSVSSVVERDGAARSLHEAWLFHLSNQRARMNGTDPMDARCSIYGIQDHGGIPEELRRGSSGCEATYIVEMDASYVYQQAYVQSVVAHAELLLRRGDSSLFDDVAADGRGSIRQAMRFVFENPTQPWPWASSHSSTMEIAYRHYLDPDMCDELRCEQPTDRVIARHNRVLGFATLTHASPPGMAPSPPPTTSPP